RGGRRDVGLRGGRHEKPNRATGGDEGPDGAGRDVEGGDALQAHSASRRVADRPTGSTMPKGAPPRKAQSVERQVPRPGWPCHHDDVTEREDGLRLAPGMELVEGVATHDEDDACRG